MQKLFILCLTLLVSASLVAQTKPTPQRPVSTMESAAVFLGKTAPLRDLAPGRVTSPEQKAKVKRMRPPRNFVGRGMPYITKPDALPTGADAVRQLGQNKSAIREVSLLANIEGISAQTRRSTSPASRFFIKMVPRLLHPSLLIPSGRI